MTRPRHLKGSLFGIWKHIQKITFSHQSWRNRIFIVASISPCNDAARTEVHPLPERRVRDHQLRVRKPAHGDLSVAYRFPGFVSLLSEPPAVSPEPEGTSRSGIRKMVQRKIETASMPWVWTSTKEARCESKRQPLLPRGPLRRQ
jgi:hypothetical protein